MGCRSVTRSAPSLGDVTEISRRQFAVYLVAVVLVVLLGGRALRPDAGSGGQAGAVPPGGFTARAEPAGGPPGEGPSGPTSAGGVEMQAEAERLLVHVAGAVRRPGVYELPGGARIRDAVTEAGGGRAGADLDALNLAAKVTDGQQVLVARRIAARSQPTAAAATPGVTAQGAAGTGVTGPAAGATVNVNQADAVQLEVLDGVGPAIALKIVDWRTQNGPFKTADDLAFVPGIGPKKLEAMRAQVTT